MRIFTWLVIVFSLLTPAVAQEPAPDYKNPKLPIEQRVADLLKRMTLEEKVDQLAGGRRRAMAEMSKPNGAQLLERMRRLFNMDSPANPREDAELRNELQKILVEKTPLGIPGLFQGEALHGYMSNGAPAFRKRWAWPARGIRSWSTRCSPPRPTRWLPRGANQAFTPVLDMARDPRWGRTEETYGEDPYLVSRMGVAAIEGLQGPNFMIDRHHVMATAKHFAVHGQPEGGTNTAPGNYLRTHSRENLPGAISGRRQEAHVGQRDGFLQRNRWRSLAHQSMAAGQSAAAGVGISGLRDLRRRRACRCWWRRITSPRTMPDAARKALAAGVDFDFSDGSVFRTLIDQVQQGKVPESEVDRAVARVLAAKFRLGLFENPYVDPDYAERDHQQPRNIASWR